MGTRKEIPINIQNLPSGMGADPSKMEICPRPQEPALKFTLFIQQMEGALVSLPPQLGASLQSHPQDTCLACFRAVLFGKGEKEK